MKDKEVSRLSRITAILTMLRSKRILTATEIADKFDVSVRTVYRDIRAIEESGVPIVTVEGKGYSLMDGYTIPPLMFTEEEANALITAERLVSLSKDESLNKHFMEALTKIKGIFRYGIKEKSELLGERIMILDGWGRARTSNMLAQVQSAITGMRLVEIDYQKPTDDAPGKRMVEPQALYYMNENWIMIAWCHLRNDFRAFRIDRIHDWVPQNTTFEDRGFDFKKYFAFEIALFGDP